MCIALQEQGTAEGTMRTVNPPIKVLSIRSGTAIPLVSVVLALAMGPQQNQQSHNGELSNNLEPEVELKCVYVIFYDLVALRYVRFATHDTTTALRARSWGGGGGVLSGPPPTTAMTAGVTTAMNHRPERSADRERGQ
jgi:hypothetical protein